MMSPDHQVARAEECKLQSIKPQGTLDGGRGEASRHSTPLITPFLHPNDPNGSTMPGVFNHIVCSIDVVIYCLGC